MEENSRSMRIANAIQHEIEGGTYEEIICDTLAGTEMWLTALANYVNKTNNLDVIVTPDSTKWTMVDMIMRNLPPQEDVDSLLKWYVMHYELYCKTNWNLTKILLDRIEDKQSLADDKEFKFLYAELKENEKIINSRLAKDGMSSLETNIWTEELKQYDGSDA